MHLFFSSYASTVLPLTSNRTSICLPYIKVKNYHVLILKEIHHDDRSESNPFEYGEDLANITKSIDCWPKVLPF